MAGGGGRRADLLGPDRPARNLKGVWGLRGGFGPDHRIYEVPDREFIKEAAMPIIAQLDICQCNAYIHILHGHLYWICNVMYNL